jgi:Tol biopolymer transport system component
LPFAGEGIILSPAISPRGQRLAYVTQFWDINIWRIAIPGPDGEVSPPTKLIASTQTQEVPQFSPDGKKIAFVSHASGSGEIWVCDRDGTHPAQLTKLGGSKPGFLRWSPDSQSIIYARNSEGQSEIYSLGAQGGKPSQLTRSPENEVNPSWSRDGRWIYFGSDKSGETQVWKMPAQGGVLFRSQKRADVRLWNPTMDGSCTM